MQLKLLTYYMENLSELLSFHLFNQKGENSERVDCKYFILPPES